MSWFSSTASKGKETASAPTREERQACWDSRDAYFACLTSHDVVVPPPADKERCPQEREAYERNCAKSWRRVLEERQKAMYKVQN